MLIFRGVKTWTFTSDCQPEEVFSVELYWFARLNEISPCWKIPHGLNHQSSEVVLKFGMMEKVTTHIINMVGDLHVINRIWNTPFPRFQLQTRYASKAVAGKPLQTGASLFVHLIWSGHTELLTNVDISGKSLDHMLRSRSTVSTCSFGSCALAMWATSMCPVSNHASTRSGAIRLKRLHTMAGDRFG